MIPALPEGAVMVVDNLSSHKGAKVAQLLDAASAKVLYLPPYSPDLNPIEQAFSKLKHLLRLARQRTTETLWKEIGQLLERFVPSERANYLTNSIYRVT